MYRKNDDAAELVCMVCQRTCAVIAKRPEAVSAHPRGFQRFLLWTLRTIDQASIAVHVFGKYTSDARFTRAVDGVRTLRIGGDPGRVVEIKDRLAVCSKACSMEALSRKQRDDPSFREWSFDPTKEDPWAS